MADLSSAQRNAINLKMRSQPWYTAWFASHGLNPNQVKLSDAQRQDLAQAATANGMPIPDHALIDQAGNVNIQHGFAGLPTWAKVAIGAGAAATGIGAAGGFGTLGSLFGFGGAAPSAATGAASVAAPAAAGGGSTVGSILGLGGAGLTTRDIVKAAIPTAVSAVTGIVASRAQAGQADRALQSELEATKYATDAQTKSAADQLAFAKEQEASRLAESRRVEALNLDQYNQGQARLAPYRALGRGAVAQLGRPITLGSVMGMG